MPGSTPATSQLDWLSSTTAMIVLSWSKATGDLLKSFSWGIGALRQLFASDDGAISFAACPIPSLRWSKEDSNRRCPVQKPQRSATVFFVRTARRTSLRMRRRFSDQGVRLSHGLGSWWSVSHRACRLALGSAPRGCGAAPRCRHDLGDRWDMPHKVLVGFCRWPGQEHARPSLGSGRRVHVPPTWLWLLLAAARGLEGESRPLLLQPKPILVADQVVPC